MICKQWVHSLALIAFSSAIAFAQTDAKPESSTAAFEKFNGLAGEWVGKGTHDGHLIDAKVVYKVTSNGSAVIETIGPGSEHEMVTLIHANGDKLALTHYCAVGNQPQMQAQPAADASNIEFDFVRATNMKSDNDMHMHSVVFTFVDRDTLKTEWTLYKDGKAAGKALFDLKRKK